MSSGNSENITENSWNMQDSITNSKAWMIYKEDLFDGEIRIWQK